MSELAFFSLTLVAWTSALLPTPTTTRVSLTRHAAATALVTTTTTTPQFDWERQWYPLAVTEFLDEKRPHRLELLGKDLVAWKAPDGWRVFDDACSHRLAPLSEGRVEEDGTLLCAYHAWRFDDEGHCVGMPQAKDLTKIVEVPKCSVPAYPTKEVDGVLWVFGDASDDGRLAALTTHANEIPVREELDDPKAQRLHWNVRDMPYGWDYFMENVMDPAHVPVSHHNIVGNRYSENQFYDMTRLSADEDFTRGFKYRVDHSNPGPDVAEVTNEFTAPSRVKITTRFKNNAKQILYLYSSPSSPGYNRHVGAQVLVRGDDDKLPKGLAFFGIPQCRNQVSILCDFDLFF